MEFFGLTRYGLSDPIKDMMRGDYKEPEKPLLNLFGTDLDGKEFSEKIKEIDCYIGFTDGYAYKSWDRLQRMRTKHVIKPVGPRDMYKYPGINSMNYGWWYGDSDLLKTNDWYKPKIIHSVTTSEMSRYINHCQKVDKHFKI